MASQDNNLRVESNKYRQHEEKKCFPSHQNKHYGRKKHWLKKKYNFETYMNIYQLFITTYTYKLVTVYITGEKNW
jgi:hypothetical protein